METFIQKEFLGTTSNDIIAGNGSILNLHDYILFIKQKLKQNRPHVGLSSPSKSIENHIKNHCVLFKNTFQICVKHPTSYV